MRIRLLDDDEAADEIRDESRRAMTLLREVRDVPTKWQRLAEIEQRIVNDLLDDARPLRCRGCVRWVQAFIDKADKADKEIK